MIRRTIQWLTIPVILLVWQASSMANLWSTALFPSPLDTGRRMIYLLGPLSNPPFLLEREVLFTLMRLVVGLLIASVIGVGLGLASGWITGVRNILFPFVSIFNSIPELALAPIIFSVAGIGDRADIIVVVIAASIPFIVECEVGIRALPQHLFWAAKSLGATRQVLLRHVVLPCLVSPLVNGVRQGTAFAWRALLAVEGISAIKYGIGYGVFQAGSFFDSQTIFANVASVVIIGIFLEIILKSVERQTVNRWGMQNV